LTKTSLILSFQHHLVIDPIGTSTDVGLGAAYAHSNYRCY